MSDAPPNPLKATQDAAGAQWLAFDEVPIVATFGEYEAEYAAVHRHVAILHQPQRGVLRLSGIAPGSAPERLDFLHRMTTQDLRALPPGSSRRSLQLNDKGRIVADMIVHHGDADTWLELDACDAPVLKTLLDGRIFTEDITIEDVSLQWTTLSLLGPSATALLDKVGVTAALPAGTHQVVTIGNARPTAYRRDDSSVHLLVNTDDAPAIYTALLEAAGYEAIDAPDADYAARRRTSLRGRPIGWLAYNTARIEAGRALFHIDFGPDSLPAEIGQPAFDDAVHLTKGCYLGQEIVARMHNLGHPRKLTMGIKFADDRMPVSGAQVFDAVDRATPVGAVTSSTVSPVLGNVAIALAVMKWGKHTPGTKVTAAAEGELVTGEVVALPFR